MRKLKLQMQLSIDGYVAGPNGEMDWMVWNWDEECKKYVAELTDPVDTILLGRKLAQGFIPHWQAIASDPANPMNDAGRKFHDTPKVVFSKTLDHSEWENTIVTGDDLTETVNHLKKEPGKDIIAYGGGNFVSNLIRQGLIDEYHLFINPSALGNGMPIFKGLEQKLNLRLVRSVSFSCGIVVLCYRPA
jgi:dihydrofolate reductase